MTSPTVACPRCGYRRRVEFGSRKACSPCLSAEDAGRWTERQLALPKGAWRIDPFTRVLRFVKDAQPNPKSSKGTP
jgi:hypothetical protein